MKHRISRSISILIACMSVYPIHAQENIIKSLDLKKHKVVVHINESFKKEYLKSDFWIEYDDEVNLQTLDYSIVTMPFITNIISIIWASGKNYYIESMDIDLYESLKTVKSIFKIIYPRTKWDGELIPHTLVSNKTLLSSKSRKAILFSGGLDSICAAFHYKNEPLLLITAFGHADTALHNKKQLEIVHNTVTNFAQKYGHTYTFFKSNYCAFLNRPKLDHLCPEVTDWRIDTVEGLGWAGLTAPILCAKQYSHLIIGSTLWWDCPYMLMSNPIMDENIILAGKKLIHDGFELSRSEKCKHVDDMCNELNLDRPSLRVCVHYNNGVNCNKCIKCVQTILGCIIEGVDYKKYGFNISQEKFIKNAQDLLKSNKLSRINVWHLKHIQEKIKKNMALFKNENLSTFLRSVLNINFNKKNKDLHHRIPQINWHLFTDIYPDIPEYLLKNR